MAAAQAARSKKAAAFSGSPSAYDPARTSALKQSAERKYDGEPSSSAKVAVALARAAPGAAAPASSKAGSTPASGKAAIAADSDAATALREERTRHLQASRKGSPKVISDAECVALLQYADANPLSHLAQRFTALSAADLATHAQSVLSGQMVRKYKWDHYDFDFPLKVSFDFVSNVQAICPVPGGSESRAVLMEAAARSLDIPHRGTTYAELLVVPSRSREKVPTVRRAYGCDKVNLL